MRSPVLFDVAAGSSVGDISLDMRPLVRDLVVGDPIGLALRLRVAGDQRLAYTRTVRGFVFDVQGPDGVMHRLEAGGLTGRAPQWMLDLDAVGVTSGGTRHLWKVPGVFSAPGTYRVEASVEVEQVGAEWLRVQSGTVVFEVRAPSAERLPLASIERLDAEEARRRAALATAPEPARVLQHVSGELSVHYVLNRSGYFADEIDVWVDRSGAITHVDAFRTSSCVAAGTSVATPQGAVPIEALAIGDEVLAFDVVHHRRAVARVEEVVVHHDRAVLGFGALTVTAEHPVWADGEWRRAGDLHGEPEFLGVDLVPQRRAPVALAATASVYDLAVTEPHTFFAGGVLVHNKSRGNFPPSVDPWGLWFYRFSAGKPD